MKRILALTVLAGCIVDIRPAIDATDKHVRAVRTIARAASLSSQERTVLMDWHAGRAMNWTKAMLKHKGAPPPEMSVTIPNTPNDRREIDEENMLLRRYEADIEREEDLKIVGGGLWKWVTGGGIAGSGILASLIKLLRDKTRLKEKVQKKDDALDEYDAAMDKLPGEQRRELGTGLALQREHEERKLRSTRQPYNLNPPLSNPRS